MDSADTQLDYQEIHEEGYEDTVARTFAAEFVPSVANPSEIYVAGPCPRCEQAMTYNHAVLIIRGIDEVDEAAAEALWRALREQGRDMPTEWSFTAFCTCGVKHPNAPDGAPGCGAYWGMTVQGSPKG
jgi:hypothetical protein